MFTFSSVEEVVQRCQRVMAHAWVVRAFVRHSDEAEDFPELQEIDRAIFDFSRALETQADDPPGTNSYVNTVYELTPGASAWVTKSPMPTARSSGVAVVQDGRIYVAGGRNPRGSDFAVYDPTTDSWEVLPELPPDDPSLELAYWSAERERWVDEEGRTLSDPIAKGAANLFRKWAE